MKGYREERGLSFKLVYDPELKQFVSKPIAHDFQPKAETNVIVKKIADFRKGPGVEKTRCQVARRLAATGPELRNNIGKTEIFAALKHP